MSLKLELADDDRFQGCIYIEMIQNATTDVITYGLYIETVALTIMINGHSDFFKTILEGGAINLDTLGKSSLKCEKIANGIKVNLHRTSSSFSNSINLDMDIVQQIYDMTRVFTFNGVKG